MKNESAKKVRQLNKYGFTKSASGAAQNTRQLKSAAAQKVWQLKKHCSSKSALAQKARQLKIISIEINIL